MSKFVYKVRCLVEQDVAEKWVRFFLDKHLADVMNTGYFTKCKFFEIQTNSKLTRTFCSEYYYEKEEDLEAYNQNSASSLKTETKDLFGDKFSCQRELLVQIGAIKRAELTSV